MVIFITFPSSSSSSSSSQSVTNFTSRAFGDAKHVKVILILLLSEFATHDSFPVYDKFPSFVGFGPFRPAWQRPSRSGRVTHVTVQLLDIALEKSKKSQINLKTIAKKSQIYSSKIHVSILIFKFLFFINFF